MKKLSVILAFLITMVYSVSVFAAGNYEAEQKIWTCPEFTFHTGEKIQNMNIGYAEAGNPEGETIVILHGTGGSGMGMWNNKNWSGNLFMEGQVLDAAKYHIILIDAIGTGKSTKPSDGMRASFPRYNYNDMVCAQYRLLTEGLGIEHVRAVIGFSMGGMHTYLWGIQHPDYMDALVPIAASPGAMSGRNYITRKFISDSIRQDPAWDNGNYTEQPKSAQFATTYYNFATNLGTANLVRKAPSYVEADKMIADAFAAPYNVDANDILYQWEASTDYDTVGFENTVAPILIINSEDDERNPIELGVCKMALKKLGHGSEYIIPTGELTCGHVTGLNASLWNKQFAKFFAKVPRKG